VKKDMIINSIIVLLITGILVTLYALSEDSMKVKTFQKIDEGNLSKVIEINGKDVSFQGIYIDKDQEITTECEVKGCGLGSSIFEISLFENKVFYCKDKVIYRRFKEGETLSVRDALQKHNMNLTFAMNLEKLKIHFWGYNKGKSVFLLLAMLTMIVYMATLKGSHIFLGLILSVFMSAGVGIYMGYYSDHDPSKEFYEKIEKMTGEKVYRNYDFF